MFLSNRFFFLVLCFAVAPILNWNQTTSAQSIVFDNGVGGAAGIDDALQSDADPLPEFGGTVAIVSDDFSVAADTEITTVEWSGLYVVSNTPDVDEFIIRIYADNGGPTGSPIATFDVGNNANRTLSPSIFMGLLNIFDYSAEISFMASANVTYWLSIDAQSFGDPNDTWFWGSLSTTGNAHNSDDIGITWSPFGQSPTLVLFGVETTTILGDVNCDGEVNLLDVGPFVDAIANGTPGKADVNEDGVTNLLDVSVFVALLSGA